MSNIRALQLVLQVIAQLQAACITVTHTSHVDRTLVHWVQTAARSHITHDMSGDAVAMARECGLLPAAPARTDST